MRAAQTRIAQLERQITKLQAQLVTDELTGLLNRRGLLQALEIIYKEVAFQLENPEKRRQVNLRAISLIFIDIDNFKRVNSQYGHEGGDRALQAVATAIKGRLRGIDIVGRYGGEEIIIGLIGAELIAAKQIAEDLRLQIAKLPIVAGGRNFSVTISCGVSQLKQGLGLEAWIKSADQAAYRAKDAGRNTVRTA